jgi:hypothetical protein
VFLGCFFDGREGEVFGALKMGLPPNSTTPTLASVLCLVFGLLRGALDGSCELRL